MGEEKSYDFMKGTSSMDDKIKNSLNSTSLAFQQTFLSKSMPDLQEIKPSSIDSDLAFPEIPSSSNGIIDAQSTPGTAFSNRRKSFGNLEDIKFFDNDQERTYGHEATYQPEVHHQVSRLLIKKRSILNDIKAPDRPKSVPNLDYQSQDNEFSIKRESNLKELTDIMVKTSPRRLTIAEEYQKFQIESKMQNDIKRAQAIVNSTHEEKVEACQTNRDGLDGWESFRLKTPAVNLTTNLNNYEEVDVPRNIEEENNKILQALRTEVDANAPPILGYTESFEPEEIIPSYNNREEKNENKENVNNQQQNSSIKLYEKKRKQKDKTNKKSSDEKKTNNNKGGGSYAQLANKKASAKKQQPVDNKSVKKPKRKVKSAGSNEEAIKPQRKSKVGETRDEVRSADPFCKCSDEDDTSEADAKHTLDHPIVKPIFYDGYVFGGNNIPPIDQNGQAHQNFMPQQQFVPMQQQFVPMQQPFMVPQGFVNQPFPPQQSGNMAPARNPVSGNLYYNQNGEIAFNNNKNFNMPGMADSNGRYDDCPLAQKYFNKVTNIRTFDSEYLQQNSHPQATMPHAPVGMYNPSLAMMHTPVGGGYTNMGQEILPPVPGHLVDDKVSKELAMSSIPANPILTNGFYEDDVNAQALKPQRITKSFSGNSSEELTNEIIRKNKAMRQKQYAETIRQHQKQPSPKAQVPSWNIRSRDEINKDLHESKRLAALQYAKSLQQQQQQSQPPQRKAPASQARPVGTQEYDREKLLESIEKMKQRHELDKVAVEELTAGRPQSKNM